MATTSFNFEEFQRTMDEMQREALIRGTAYGSLTPGEVRMVDPYGESMIDYSQRRRGLEKPPLVFQRKFVTQELPWDGNPLRTRYRMSVQVRVMYPDRVSSQTYGDYAEFNDMSEKYQVKDALIEISSAIKEKIQKEYYESR